VWFFIFYYATPAVHLTLFANSHSTLGLAESNGFLITPSTTGAATSPVIVTDAHAPTGAEAALAVAKAEAAPTLGSLIWLLFNLFLF
jgi:hypothetical protein